MLTAQDIADKRAKIAGLRERIAVLRQKIAQVRELKARESLPPEDFEPAGSRIPLPQSKAPIDVIDPLRAPIGPQPASGIGNVYERLGDMLAPRAKKEATAALGLAGGLIPPGAFSPGPANPAQATENVRGMAEMVPRTAQTMADLQALSNPANPEYQQALMRLKEKPVIETLADVGMAFGALQGLGALAQKVRGGARPVGAARPVEEPVRPAPEALPVEPRPTVTPTEQYAAPAGPPTQVKQYGRPIGPKVPKEKVAPVEPAKPLETIEAAPPDRFPEPGKTMPEAAPKAKEPTNQIVAKDYTRGEFLREVFDRSVLERVNQDHWEALHRQRIEEAARRGDALRPEVLADYPDLAAKYGKKAEPPPAELGEGKGATKPTIAQSVKQATDGMVESTRSFEETLPEILGKIDEALKTAPLGRAVPNKSGPKGFYNVPDFVSSDAVKIMNPDAPRGVIGEVGFLEFSVPGDGTFKVRNTQESLSEFRTRMVKRGRGAGESRGLPSLRTSRDAFTAQLRKDAKEGNVESFNEQAQFRSESDADRSVIIAEEELRRLESEVDYRRRRKATNEQIEDARKVVATAKRQRDYIFNPTPPRAGGGETVNPLDPTQAIPESGRVTKAPVFGTADGLESGGIVEMHAGPTPASAVKALRRVTPDFVKQARNRINDHPQGKILADALEWQADPRSAELAGGMLEDLRQAGFNKLNKAQAEELGRALDGKGPETPLSKKVGEIMTEAYKTAKESGVNVAGFVRKYFPRMIKRDVAEVMFDDLMSAQRKHSELVRSGFEDSPRLNKIVESLMERGLKDYTKQAIQHMMKTKQAKSYAEAFYKLRQGVYNDIFRAFGNLEKSRTVALPDGFYEMDARQVIPRYLSSWAKRVAEVETFGERGQVAQSLLDAIAETDPAKGRVAKQILDSWSGAIEIERGLPGWARKAHRAYRGFALAGRIGGGFAALKNVAQIVSSTATDLGWRHTVNGIVRLFDPQFRSQWVRRSGSTIPTALETLSGEAPTTAGGKMVDAILKGSGFTGINKVNQYTAASAAYEAVHSWHKAANGGGVLPKIPGIGPKYRSWAKERLGDFKIDWSKPLQEKDVKRAMYRFATDSQLQRNVLADPLAFNDPRIRPFALFKRFGVRQAVYIKDTLIREGKRGNVMPLARLVVGTVVVNETLIEPSMRAVRQFLSGEPQPKEEKEMAERLVDDFANVGALGVVGDMVSAEDKFRSLEFVVTPIQVNDFMRGYESLQRAWEDLDLGELVKVPPGDPIPRRTAGEVAVREGARIGPRYLGTFATEAAKRLQTPEQKKARTTTAFREEHDKMFRALFRGDKDEVRRLVKNWNAKHPERPITTDDLSIDAYNEWFSRRVAGRQGK